MFSGTMTELTAVVVGRTGYQPYSGIFLLLLLLHSSILLLFHLFSVPRNQIGPSRQVFVPRKQVFSIVGKKVASGNLAL